MAESPASPQRTGRCRPDRYRARAGPGRSASGAVGLGAALFLSSTLAAPVDAEPRPPSPEEPPAGGAVVHTRLESAEPGDGDTLSASPERIRLVFSGPVQAGASRIEITGGQSGVRLTPAVARPEGRRAVLVGSLPELGSGSYHVSWRTLSADGHPVAGTYTFRVELPPTPGPADTAGAEPAAPDSETAAEGAGTAGTAAGEETAGAVRDGTDHPLWASLLRGLSDAVLLALAGLLLFVAWLAPEPSPEARSAVRVLAVGAPFLLLAHLAAWATYASGGSLWDSGTWGVVAGATTGRLEGARLLLAFGCLGLVAGGGREGRAGAAASLAVVAVLLGGGLGHPATYASLWTVPAKAVHLVAGALWLGGLILLGTGGDDAGRFRRNARRVSAVALASVVAIVATGLLQAVLFLPSLDALLGTGYGLAIVGKGAGLAVLVGFGYRHRFHLLPALGEEGADGGALRRSVGREAAVVVAVVLLAGFLAYLSPDPRTSMPLR